MPRHKVVTVARGEADDGAPGYAARCEDCEAITFGGFPTRTAARQALLHEEAPSMSGNSAEGEKSYTNHHEGVQTVSKTTEPLSEEEYAAQFLEVHPDISEGAPSWTDELELDFDPLDETNTVFTVARRVVGAYQIHQVGSWCGGEVEPLREIALWHPDEESFTANTPRDLAAYARARALELLTIAATLEAEAVRA